MSTGEQEQSLLVNGPNAIPDPAIRDLLLALKLEIFRTLHCVKPGSIQSFDGTKKTATVQILLKRVMPDNTIAEYPLLVDVPVFTLQGGGGAIYAPIAAGDNCIVLFSDRNLDAWYANGSPAAPFDARCHSLADGLAIVGINSLASALGSYEAGKMAMKYQGAEVSITATELKAEREDSLLSLKDTEMKMERLDGLVSLTDAGATLSQSDTEVTAMASGLVKIKNAATSLQKVIDDLITAIEAITVQDETSTWPITAASIVALEVVRAEMDTLLSN